MKLTAVRLAPALVAAFVVAGIPGPSPAETSKITIAKQFGVSFLPLLVMERNKLVEKHAKALGIPLEANFVEVAGPSVINDGLLSGTVNFAAVGAPSLITLWAKTKDNVGIKGVAAMTTYPLYLNVSNPNIKSVRDFTEKDKIVVPSIRVSTQAILLQMEAAKVFGQANYAKLDPLTVGMSHPDGLAALKNGTGGIDAHFTSSPYSEEELKFPNVRTLMTSYDIMGGPATAITIAGTTKFRESDPKAYRAFYDALTEAIDTVNRDKRAAAKLYVSANKGITETPDQVYGMISHKDYAYTLAPAKVYATAEFMHRTGALKELPASWKDMFFPEVQGLAGS